MVTDPQATVICFPDPMAMVTRGGVEAEGAAGTAIVMEATSIDSPISSPAPVMLCTMAKVTWNRQESRASAPTGCSVRRWRAATAAGIAKLVLHNTEHLVAVRSLMGHLTLQTMHFIDELVDPRSVGALPPTQKISAKELEVAEKLIAGMSADCDPSAYHDDHTARLQ